MVNIELGRDEKVGNRWRVVKKIAEGGFGAVYMCIDEVTHAECAVKIEPSDQNSVLKMEAYALMQLRGRTYHACAFLGCGRQDGKMNYLVMSLVGRSMADLQKSRPDRRFSHATVARLAIQCIEGLEDIHKVGLVHRDVKPGNLAIGRTEQDRRIVYVLDFGLVRRYKEESSEKEIRPARASIGFRGTVRYASTNVHNGLEQGRHDDLISLCYVLAEFRSCRLPWSDLDDDEEVARVKKDISTSILFKDMEVEYREIYGALIRFEYKDAPDYAAMIDRIKNAQKRNKHPTDGPFEWE